MEPEKLHPCSSIFSPSLPPPPSSIFACQRQRYSASGQQQEISLKIPASSATVSVAIINTTAWASHVPCAGLFKPAFKGLDTFDLCSYSFLVTHRGEDSENLVPNIVAKLKQWGTTLEIEKDVADVLVEHDTKLDEIEAIVWSHLHWDHTGNPARFPSSVKLIVGPGLKEAQMPGWPANSSAEINEADVAGREVVEIAESQFTADVGGMPGYDYFGDGSFYLLDAPGHSLGHINALARTETSPESFIFMAADSVHLGGEFRPTEAFPLPKVVDVPGLTPCPCSCEQLLKFHPRDSPTKPYLGLDPRFPEHLVAAEKTISHIQRFDADERVLFIYAHDITMFEMLDYFPQTVDNWRSKSWKAESRWKFLVDLQQIARKRAA
ncbi:hypothetical protein NM208_g8960 [Fusarium decemcellulare]|uniref:Uncharacterized protein n=1 Tax=Fusarium decemcellulare TaxID=57161 RepID=A0ACC1S3A8_9HYPO|nr:hypothetical protein NM208_g8960 [Fusarium decemcellulare]